MSSIPSTLKGALLTSFVLHVGLVVGARTQRAETMVRVAPARQAVALETQIETEQQPAAAGGPAPDNVGAVEGATPPEHQGVAPARAVRIDPVPAIPVADQSVEAADEAVAAVSALPASTVPLPGGPVRFALPALQANRTQEPSRVPAKPMTYDTQQVNTPARLRATRVAVYPPAARAAEIEANVPLEIVVDETGRVQDARTLDHVGYGLDESALSAIVGYHFSPAIKDGVAVRVRMRWVVQFRLR
ncbi:MAG TPA: TonB family protein [Polyangiaceae bacterium]|nr:TonB family protein [Polyangiaceae bacterium]